MLPFVFLGIAFVSGFHAMFTNCESMLFFAGVCIGVSFLVECRQAMPVWLRHILTGMTVGALGFVACVSVQQYQIYCGRLAEYKYLAVETLLAMALYFLSLLPHKQKTAA